MEQQPAQPPELRPEPTIEIEWSGTDVTIVRLLGEHDLLSAPELDDQLRSLTRCGEHIVVDLSETAFIDSSIMHALIETHAATARRQQRLVLLLATEPPVRRALEISGVLDTLDHAPTLEQALALARSPRPPARRPDEDSRQG